MRRTLARALLALALVAVVAPAASAGHRWGSGGGGTATSYGFHDYVYNHDTDTWKDEVCEAPGGYAFILYEHSQYQGAKTRICHGSTSRWNDCTEPECFGDGYHGNGCEVPLTTAYAIDWRAAVLNCRSQGSNSPAPWTLLRKASGIKVLSNLNGRCIRLYKETSQRGPFVQFTTGATWDNLNAIGGGWNDAVESWQIADCNHGQPIYD